MEYLGVGEPVVNSPSADKGIITLAINLNLNYYMKNIENRTLYHASKKRKRPDKYVKKKQKQKQKTKQRKNCW